MSNIFYTTTFILLLASNVMAKRNTPEEVLPIVTDKAVFSVPHFAYLNDTQIDVAALPQLSEAVREKCDDLDCPLVEAVKAYRDETGLGLSEAKAVVDFYRASNSPKEQDSVPNGCLTFALLNK